MIMFICYKLERYFVRLLDLDLDYTEIGDFLILYVTKMTNCRLKYSAKLFAMKHVVKHAWISNTAPTQLF